jgi:hypothetical protein
MIQCYYNQILTIRQTRSPKGNRIKTGSLDSIVKKGSRPSHSLCWGYLSFAILPR